MTCLYVELSSMYRGVVHVFRACLPACLSGGLMGRAYFWVCVLQWIFDSNDYIDFTYVYVYYIYKYILYIMIYIYTYVYTSHYIIL